MATYAATIDNQTLTTTSSLGFMVVVPTSTKFLVQQAERSINAYEQHIARLTLLADNPDLVDAMNTQIDDCKKSIQKQVKRIAELNTNGLVTYVRASMHGTYLAADKAANSPKNRSTVYGYDTQVVELQKVTA